MILITYSFIATIVCVYLLSALKWFVRDTNIWNKAFFSKTLYFMAKEVMSSTLNRETKDIIFHFPIIPIPL